jgi:hypothetical protein
MGEGGAEEEVEDAEDGEKEGGVMLRGEVERRGGRRPLLETCSTTRVMWIVWATWVIRR